MHLLVPKDYNISFKPWVYEAHFLLSLALIVLSVLLQVSLLLLRERVACSCLGHHRLVLFATTLLSWQTLPFLLHPQSANSLFTDADSYSKKRDISWAPLLNNYIIIGGKQKKKKRKALWLISMPANAQATVSRSKLVNTENKWFAILVKFWMECALLTSSIQFCLLAYATVNVQLLRNAEEKRRMNSHLAVSSTTKSVLLSYW